jgi:hypothetical protein
VENRSESSSFLKLQIGLRLQVPITNSQRLVTPLGYRFPVSISPPSKASKLLSSFSLRAFRIWLVSDFATGSNAYGQFSGTNTKE